MSAISGMVDFGGATVASAAEVRIRSGNIIEVGSEDTIYHREPYELVMADVCHQSVPVATQED